MITPQTEAPEIAKELGIPKLYLKREDLHPYGSHKGRSIPAMIDAKAFRGAKAFAVSSSGNAAIAAAKHIAKRNKEGADLRLTIFVGGNVNPEKKSLLKNLVFDERIQVVDSPRPLQSLLNLLKGPGEKIESLRQSTDSDALAGYKPLAQEIMGTPDLGAVFIGTSSGTAAQALGDSFAEANKGTELHIVQTSSISPIASAFDADEPKDEMSVADAIVDKVAHRRASLEESIRKTGGSGWIASNSDISIAQKLLKERAGVDATANGALGLAGLLRALSKGYRPKGAVVVIITGK